MKTRTLPVYEAVRQLTDSIRAQEAAKLRLAVVRNFDGTLSPRKRKPRLSAKRRAALEKAWEARRKQGREQRLARKAQAKAPTVESK